MPQAQPGLVYSNTSPAVSTHLTSSEVEAQQGMSVKVLR